MVEKFGNNKFDQCLSVVDDIVTTPKKAWTATKKKAASAQKSAARKETTKSRYPMKCGLTLC